MQAKKQSKMRIAVVLTTVMLLSIVFATSAFASDHLFNAANAPGATARGFTNPVAANPSGGVALMHAQPATVPGEGNPNAGADLGTPAVDLTLVPVRSGHHGHPMH